jgi:membrane-associated phospholipid phosphatase
LEKVLRGTPLLSDRLRRWVPMVTVIAAAGLGGLGFDTRHSSRPVLFDRRVDAFLTRASGFDHRLAILLRELGDPKIFTAVTAVVAVVLILVGDYRGAAATVVSVGVGLVLVEEVLKPFFNRRLGDVPGPTFPSGHTTVAVALAGAVVLAARGDRPLGRLLGRALRYVLMAIVVAVSCAIGPAMVALQEHYITDVLAGFLLGLAVTGCTAAVLDTVATHGVRRLTPQPDPPSGRSRLRAAWATKPLPTVERLRGRPRRPLLGGSDKVEHPAHSEAVETRAPRCAPEHLGQWCAFAGAFGQRVE